MKSLTIAGHSRNVSSVLHRWTSTGHWKAFGSFGAALSRTASRLCALYLGFGGFRRTTVGTTRCLQSVASSALLFARKLVTQARSENLNRGVRFPIWIASH